MQRTALRAAANAGRSAAETGVGVPKVSKDRVPIPDDLAAKVMFASDRTCCVCRLERHKVQLHHIDGDPSNNAIDNVAVICLHCHSDAHTTGAFVRNLTPELIRLYNSSWRDIVRLRLRPPAEGAGKMELAAEAFLEASLDAHRWRVWFMSLAAPNLPGGKPGEFVDVWDVMAERWIPKYTKEAYSRFSPLFGDGLREVRGRFDRLIQLFPDVLPPDFRSLLVRANRQLEVEQSVYLQLPGLLGGVVPAQQCGPLFYERFVEVIRVLRDVARDADRRRESLTTTQ